MKSLFFWWFGSRPSTGGATFPAAIFEATQTVVPIDHDQTVSLTERTQSITTTRRTVTFDEEDAT